MPQMPASAAPVAHAEPTDDVVGRRVVGTKKTDRDRRGADRAEGASSGDGDDDAEAGLIDHDPPHVEGRVVVEHLPGGYQIVAVEASRVHVVTAAPAAADADGHPNVWAWQRRELLPYPGEGRWHHDLMERCCDCGGDCAMAWLCAVFPVAQIAERLKAMGIVKQGFNDVLFVAVLWMVADLLITAVTKEDSWTFPIYLSVVCCQLRGVVRTVLKIPGSAWDDCLVSLLCQPCVLLQMVGTLWASPKEAPGCSFDESSAFVV